MGFMDWLWDDSGESSSWTSKASDDIYDDWTSDSFWASEPVDNDDLWASGSGTGWDAYSDIGASMGGDDGYVFDVGGYDFLSPGYDPLESPDSGGGLLGKVGDFLGSKQGLGMLQGAGTLAAQYYMNQQQHEQALDMLRREQQYAMELARLKAMLAAGHKGGGGGGGGGKPDETAHNAGIKALAEKYPPDKNFKRNWS